MTTERGHTLDMEGAGAPVPSSTLSVPCTCPGAPHEHDTVTLRSEITNTMGMAAVSAIRMILSSGGTFADALGAVANVYLHTGIAAWSKVTDKGEPEPITPAVIDRLLPFGKGGHAVAEAADALYSEDLLSPLGGLFSTPSPPTPTADSTSPTPASGSTRPKPSPSSSPTDTDGKPSEDPAP